MIEAVLILLIKVVVIAGLVWLALWVLTSVIGIALPKRAEQIIWVIFLLVVLLLVYQTFFSGSGLHLGLT